MVITPDVSSPQCGELQLGYAFNLLHLSHSANGSTEFDARYQYPKRHGIYICNFPKFPRVFHRIPIDKMKGGRMREEVELPYAFLLSNDVSRDSRGSYPLDGKNFLGWSALYAIHFIQCYLSCSIHRNILEPQH
jgi:hypothetical protein